MTTKMTIAASLSLYNMLEAMLFEKVTDEEGKESNFELLDLVELDNEEYVVLLPVTEEGGKKSSF